MDYVQVFNDELQSVLRTNPSISKAKMIQITRAAIKGIKFYKHIVQTVEKFIARCRPEYMISGLYVIDSIVRQSRHQFGNERDVYTTRFSKNICITFETLFSNCLPDDKPKIIRVLNLWQKNGVFDTQTIASLMDLANTTTSRLYPKSPDGNPDAPSHSSRYSAQIRPNNSLRFTKDLLDFDYGEDDDDGDETPTEAEPPLSSTLGKLKGKSRLSSSPQIEPSYMKQDRTQSRWHSMLSAGSTSIDNQVQGDPLRGSISKKRSRSRSPIAPRIESAESSEKSDVRIPIVKDPPIIQDAASRQAERAAERERRCLPNIRDKHLTVCSCTLWLGHMPKSVSEVDISDAFGEYGTISSIDLVPPRGCAYICMDRRQDAKRALDESKDLKLKNSHIKLAWAPGKGFKEYKKLKDFWEADVGASFIPYSKVDHMIDFDVLEEGGSIDEDSMSMEMRERREVQTKEKKMNKDNPSTANLNISMPTISMLNHPPSSIQPFSMPPPNLGLPPPSGLIPFPPPGVATTSTSNHLTFPPPSAFLHLNSQISANYQDGHDLEKPDCLNSPPSIDQQLSMTERQISMVEQQLSMIQQAQGMNRNPVQSIQPIQHPQPMFHHQPNQMVFDMAMNQHMMQSAHGMMDPSLSIFASHQINNMAPASMMVPTSFANSSAMMGFNENLNEHHGNY